MKVMQLLSSDIFSGAESIACEIIHLFESEAEMVYVSPKGSNVDSLDARGVQSFYLEKLSIRQIRNAVQVLKPDVIHAHDFRASVLSVMACPGIPVISHIHHNSPWLRKVNAYTLVYLFISLSVKKIIGVSNSILDEYRFKRYIKRKFKLLPNPVDTKRIKELSRADVLDIPYYDFIYVGRLSEEKDPMRFLRIMHRLISKHSTIKGLIIGDGPLYSACLEFIREQKLDHSVIMLGFVHNPYPYMLNSRIMIVPSKWEGYGLVAAEGLTLGCPVIASRVGGLSDIVDDSCGMLCSTDDEFINEATRLLTNQRYYNEKSKNAGIKASELDNQEQFKRALIQLYREAMAGR